MQDEFWNALFQRFSTWERLRRVIAWLIRVFQKRSVTKADKAKDGSSLKNKRNLSLSVSELEQAERSIIKCVQQGSFPEDTVKAKKGDLAQLKDGLLRLGGRLDRPSLNYDAKLTPVHLT